MRLSREASNFLREVFDQVVPPFLHDSKLFMAPLINIVFGSKASHFIEFRNKVPTMSGSDYAALYGEINRAADARSTDLNRKSIIEIVAAIVGENVLEVGCGSGFLANELSKRFKIVASDIVIDDTLRQRYPQIVFVQGEIERLPFSAGEFDTVICAHTLEHIPNLNGALTELRRVAKRRLIIVVPRQRPYLYTPDLHVQFFPYKFSLLAALGNTSPARCEDIGGDWFYVEDLR